MRAFILFMIALSVASWQAVANEEKTQFNQKVDQLKRSVLELNKNLYQLEDELLNPATTKAAVYFSLNYGQFFSPSSVEVEINGKLEAAHLYTEKQISALAQGAIQPLHFFNVGLGQHAVKVMVKGEDANGKEKELVKELDVTKTDKPLYIELKVADNKQEQKAELLITQW